MYINNLGHMTKMAACPYMVKTFQNHLLRNRWINVYINHNRALIVTYLLQYYYRLPRRFKGENCKNVI